MGGIEIVAYNQAKELVKKGHQVTIVSSRIGNEPREETIDGIRVVRVKAWNFFERKYGIPYPIYSPKLILVLNKEVINADIVHVHETFYLSPFVAAILSRSNRKELVLTQHVGLIKVKRKFVNLIQKIVSKTYGKFIAKSASRILVCNPEYIRSLGYPDKTQFIPNAVDVKLFTPARRGEKNRIRRKYHLPINKKIVLFVGRFVEKKGFDKLFAARDKEYFIIFIGEGDIPKFMSKDKNCKFLPFMNSQKLSEFYKLSDMFCLPSHGEGFPLTILEAMASGLPIITTDHPGYSHYLDKRYVQLINPNTDKIRKSITLISGNSQVLKKMSLYSRKEAVNRFSWDSNIQGLIKLYGKVLNEHQNKSK